MWRVLRFPRPATHRRTTVARVTVDEGRHEAVDTPQTAGGQGTEGGPEELREELRLVDEELADLRAAAAGLRGELGGRGAGPMDLAENAATVTFAEEQEALIRVLERRRERLLRKLEAA